MKLVITERSKHRMIGILVVVSVAVIFLPAVMKKSNHRFEENINVSLKLPTRPALPRVAIPNQSVMFKSVKVAHVQIPATPKVRTTSLIAKAAPLNSKSNVQQPVAIATVEKPAQVAKPTKPIMIASINQTFSIQVATFTQRSNADIMVKRLRDKGFLATYKTIPGAQGELYQVVVGQLNRLEKAVDLQKKLAVNMQLNGLIVKKG
ncbi:MAG: SPOR domain-containing protein [Legionellaceae bacterium]|nr:SPOR domain-containing protein [Legionellaceae bacterium]